MRSWIVLLCFVGNQEGNYETVSRFKYKEPAMINEFKYMKEGIAADLVQYLMNDYKMDMLSALNTFYESETYAKLNNPATGLYFQSSPYIYSYLQHELQHGVIG